jgi:hypothetical protein
MNLSPAAIASFHAELEKIAYQSERMEFEKVASTIFYDWDDLTEMEKDAFFEKVLPALARAGRAAGGAIGRGAEAIGGGLAKGWQSMVGSFRGTGQSAAATALRAKKPPLVQFGAGAAAGGRGPIAGTAAVQPGKYMAGSGGYQRGIYGT